MSGSPNLWSLGRKKERKKERKKDILTYSKG
jgi:hypothetical protein